MPKSAIVSTRQLVRPLLLAFFLTGLISLVMEVVWTRQLLLALGTTPVAMGLVLAAFMGGMAGGAWLAGSRVLRVLPPLVVYAGLEAWVGVYALTTPFLLARVSLVDPSFQLAVGLLALLPATVPMGISLPVLARVLDGGSEGQASTVGWLYAVNTAGAVAGPLVAVFVLFPALGLSSTLAVAAAANLAVALWVGLLARRHFGVDRPEPPAEVSAPRWLRWGLAVSGGAAMIYEMAWTRTLSMVYGSSVYGVSITLSTFLAGLAIGSAVAAAVLKRRPVGAGGAAWLLAASAWAAFISLSVGPRLPYLFLDLFRVTDGGSWLFLGQGVLASLLMLPTTLCLGALIPVSVELVRTGSSRANVSSLYGANLIGSALGALLASAMLFDSVDLSAAVQTGVLAALVCGIVMAWRAPGRHPGVVAASAVGIMILLTIDGTARRLPLSFGLYHGARDYVGNDDRGMRELLASHELLYYRDGPTASVAVQKVDRYLLMKINGKTDASTGAGDIETQTLLGHLPLFAAPEAERVAVIGFGSGMTAGAILSHPVRLVDAFEIEPAVVEASAFFEPINGQPLDDERLRLVLGDARGELRRETEPYDVIISEPSNPWITGVANLFTRDFFELGRSRLSPGGVFAQWFHLYGMSEEAAREVVATFRAVFPHVVAFKDRDLILLGSERPLQFSLDQMAERFASPRVRASLAEAYVRYPADLLVQLRLDDAGTAAFAANARLNTDDNMRLELDAPRSLYADRLEPIQAEMDRHAPAPMTLLAEPGPPGRAALELAASYFTAGRHDEALAFCERALAEAPSFEGLKLLGQIAEQQGDLDRARQAWHLALAAGGDPGQRALVEALLTGVNIAAN